MRAQFHHGFLSHGRGSARFRDRRCYCRLGWFECAGHSHNRKTDRSLRKHAPQSGNAPTSHYQGSCQSRENHRNRWPGTTPCPSRSCANWVGLARYSSQIEWTLGQLGGYRSRLKSKRSGSDITISESGGGVFVCGKEIEESTHPRPGRRIRVHSQMLDTLPLGSTTSSQSRTGQPDEEETPTDEQFIGIERESDRSTGFPLRRSRRKTTRAHRFTAYLLVGKEIPGPTNYQAWLCCWRVFHVVCLMLKVAHEVPLDRHQRKIEKLATQWPTA